MRKTLKRITTIFMVMLTVLSCCSSALAAPDKAVIDVVYDENGNVIGFNTITVGDTVYYNVLPDMYETLDEISIAEFYKYVLTSNYNGTSPLETWSHVAENVFRIAGPTHGYNWEFEEYDKWFAQYFKQPFFPYEFSMWQYSSTGKIDGINGGVDLNMGLVDYASHSTN